MNLKPAVAFAVCFAAVLGLVAAGIAPLPERAPHGCYPVRLTVQTNAHELILRLTNTVPGVNYLVMVRSNQPYARWLPFTYIIGITNDHLDAFRISLKSGEADGVMQQTALHHIPARVLCQMQFTAGSGEDADGDALPDLYEDLVTRTDPLNGGTGNRGEDGYGDPDGDGWNNIQEYQNGTDPYSWDAPPGPSAVQVRMKLNPGSQTTGTAALAWYQTGVVPEFYTIMRKPASAPDSAWEVAARIKPVLNKFQQYDYDDTNVNTFRPPVYRIYGNHQTPPPWVVPSRCDTEGIRQTMRQVACVATADGYALTVAKTVSRALYLMLVREGKGGFWKASGFFVGSTNGSPLKLPSDKRGMLTTASGPYVLPVVEHVPILNQPEFICGSGEDADGDGLPDIYEVLATKTAPDKSDTGATGLLDGYKDLAGDGWTALEKYRRRCDPFAPDHPPAPIELTEPTQMQVMKALWQAQQYDFQYDVKLEARKLNPPGEYQALQENSAPLFPPMQRDKPATNLQIRITVEVPEKKAPPHHVGGP